MGRTITNTNTIKLTNIAENKELEVHLDHLRDRKIDILIQYLHFLDSTEVKEVQIEASAIFPLNSAPRFRINKNHQDVTITIESNYINFAGKNETFRIDIELVEEGIGYDIESFSGESFFDGSSKGFLSIR